MVWGKFGLNFGRSTTDVFPHELDSRQYISLKELFEGYLRATEIDPIFIKDVRKNLLAQGNQERLRIIEILDKLYALAIGSR